MGPNVRPTAVLARIVIAASLLHPGLIPSHVLAQPGPGRPADPGRIIAVVPFVNVSGNPTDDWIGPGIAESLIADLWERDDVTVVDPARARQELGATFLVTGGYQRVGDRLRVTASLVEVEGGTHVASTVVDGAYDELFELQDRISADLLAELDGRPSSRLTDVPAITDFIQVEPDVGQPATEETEAWLFFDDTSIYISARAWDSSPESQWIANEMRRHSFSILRNDNIGFAIDTFYDGGIRTCSRSRPWAAGWTDR